MAKLIVKSPYIKGGSGGGGGAGGYLKYIGTREGVELLPAGYMEYMAERPRAHGLFGDEDSVDMDAAMKKLNEYSGNIWTHVISLKREDAVHHGSDCAAYQLGMEYLKGKVVERDSAKALEYLAQSAETGNQFAQYALGKLYLDRQDHEQAHYWFSQSAAQGNEYAQFFLDRWDNLKPPSIMLSVSRLLHHMGRIFQEQAPVPSVPGGIQIGRKRLAQLREKKIAMGHKPDDHEEQTPSWAMSM